MTTKRARTKPKRAASQKATPKKPAKKAAFKKAAPTKVSKQALPKKAAKPAVSNEGASDLIDMRIDELGDWRGPMLARLRAVITGADRGIAEEWKWSVPVWSSGGIICTGETYKSTVKLTFAKGASLPDPAKLFNSSLGGGTRRAIDLREGDEVNEPALQALVRAAIELNHARR